MTTEAENKIDDKEVIETANSPVTSNEKTKAVTNSPQNNQSSEVIKEQPCGVPPNAKRSESASPEPKRNRKDGTSSSAVSSSPTKESQNKNVKPMKKVDWSPIKPHTKLIIERPSAAETLRREKENADAEARKRQRIDEERMNPKMEQQDPPYDGSPCEGCLQLSSITRESEARRKRERN